MNTKSCLSTLRQEDYRTPRDLYERCNRAYGPFDLDPCASAENALTARYFTREMDGLAMTWTGRVFMNPPYSRDLGKWILKAWSSAMTTAAVVVCLIPCRTDTKWWHTYVDGNPVHFLRGRVKFGNARDRCPFPCCIVVFGEEANPTWQS